MNAQMKTPLGPTSGAEVSKADSRKGSATAHGVQPRKWKRVAQAFYDGRRLNRFEAARTLRDWCLPSTVSGLEARGLVILRTDEMVPGAFGPVRCCRYWLAPGSRALAAELLAE